MAFPGVSRGRMAAIKSARSPPANGGEGAPHPPSRPLGVVYVMAPPLARIYIYICPRFRADTHVSLASERASDNFPYRACRSLIRIRRIAIKPSRSARASARLFSPRDSPVHCPDHRQPSSRRSTDIGPGSRWPYPIQSCLPHRNSRRTKFACMRYHQGHHLLRLCRASSRSPFPRDPPPPPTFHALLYCPSPPRFT